MTWTLVRGEARNCNTFGVEIETEFEGGCPLYLYAYHDNMGGDERVFPDWRTEDDCSLHGGAEVISPVLRDASGVAEIIATFSILRGLNARMTRRCGQHTSVMTTDGSRQSQMKVVRITAALEDALLAMTGSLSRFTGANSYSPTIKSGGDSFLTRDDWYGSGGSANPRGDGRIEFRYPPGTLVASQAAMNVGLCQLIVKKAHEMSMSEASDMARESISVASGGTEVPRDRYGYSRLPRPNGERTHELIKHGLSILNEWGWGFDGNFDGLPYHPDNTPQYITDILGGFDVRLPGRRRISARINRQINNFYSRMIGEFPDLEGQDATSMAEEALGVLNREEALLA